MTCMAETALVECWNLALRTSPAITNERLKRNHAGDTVLQLEIPYQDGITNIEMLQLEFIYQ